MNQGTKITAKSILLIMAFSFSLISANCQSRDLADFSISQLEAKRHEIDSELKGLANYSLRSGVGAIGYRSATHESPDVNEWIEIDLGEESPIDEIVLVPTIWRDTDEGFKADAFPIAFKIVAGSTGDPKGQVIAQSDPSVSLLPRLAPLRVSTPGAIASWIRIETSELTARAYDGFYVLQLAEVMVFNGQENLALKRPLKTSSNTHDSVGAWDQNFLVDGYLPYLMDSSTGRKSLAYISTIGTAPTLIMDLERPYSISRIHLHSVDQSDTVPQAYAGDLGIPQRLQIEGSLRPDFKNAQLLYEYKQDGLNETGPIIELRFPEQTCRYVRFTPYVSSQTSNPAKSRIGFAEIELFSKGQNVALGKTVRTTEDYKYKDNNRSLTALTDGENLYGTILPIRKWVEELSRRHDLEVEKPIVAAELSYRYNRQQKILHRTSWLAAALAVAIGFIILFDRNLRMRQAARIRQRLAADLHDELGANLHAIGILCDLAKDSIDSKEDLIELLERTRVFTERSGMAARYCTNMLEAKGICEDLVDEIRRTGRRLLCDLEHQITIEGETILKDLSPRKRIDLFFFYKESLTNIIRHSGATKVITHITATSKRIHLSITDNGHGIPDSSFRGVPPSLKRRARLLHARVSIEHPPEGGNRILLNLRTRKFLIFK